MNVYEVVLHGFDGSTDETDHLIKWVGADCGHDVITVCKRNNWEYTQIELLPYEYNTVTTDDDF